MCENQPESFNTEKNSSLNRLSKFRFVSCPHRILSTYEEKENDTTGLLVPDVGGGSVLTSGRRFFENDAQPANRKTKRRINSPRRLAPLTIVTFFFAIYSPNFSILYQLLKLLQKNFQTNRMGSPFLPFPVDTPAFTCYKKLN